MDEALSICKSKVEEYGSPLVIETLESIGEDISLSGASSIDDVEVLKDEMKTLKHKVNNTIKELKRLKKNERTQDQQLKSQDQQLKNQDQQLKTLMEYMKRQMFSNISIVLTRLFDLYLKKKILLTNQTVGEYLKNSFSNDSIAAQAQVATGLTLEQMKQIHYDIRGRRNQLMHEDLPFIEDTREALVWIEENQSNLLSFFNKVVEELYQ